MDKLGECLKWGMELIEKREIAYLFKIFGNSETEERATAELKKNLKNKKYVLRRLSSLGNAPYLVVRLTHFYLLGFRNPL